MLELAPTPARGRTRSRPKIAGALRRAGRQRNVEVWAEQIHTALRAPQLEQPPLVADAFGAAVASYVAVLAASVTQARALEGRLEASLGRHPAAEILLSQPGLGQHPRRPGFSPSSGTTRTATPAPSPARTTPARAPITKASGTGKVVLARVATNKRLRDAAPSSLHRDRGLSRARAYYDQRRAAGATHHQALRAVSNRLVGILHGCLRHGARYDEETAWPTRQPQHRLIA